MDEPQALSGGWRVKSAKLFGEVLVPAGSAAAKTYVITLLGMFAFSALVAVAAGFMAWSRVWWAGAVALLASAALGVALSFVMAGKRALAAGVARVVKQAQLGSKLLTLLLEALMRVDSAGWHGARGNDVAQKIERLPLQQAEQKLSAVVDGIMKEPVDQRGVRAWLARKVRAAVLTRVQFLTLAKFRQQNQAHGGVDLAIVGRELGGSIDQLVLDRFAGSQMMLSAVLIVAHLLASFGSAYLLRSL